MFLVVFVVLSLTGSSFGGIWNSGLWTTRPARRCEGGDSFLLRRRPYDKTFKKEQYSPDPSEPDRSWLGLRDWRTLWESGVEWAVGRVDLAGAEGGKAVKVLDRFDRFD